MNFEEELRAALRVEQPSRDFTGRVLTRVERRRRERAVRRWMAIAAMLFVTLLVGARLWIHQRETRAIRQRLVAERAGRDLAIALKITGAKLQYTHRVLRRKTSGV